MTSERIREIQEETAYPNSVSVQHALLKVWNECAQANQPVSEVSDEWIDLKTQLPTPKDLPFITEDFDKFYEVWEDSDYFDELTDNDRDLFVKWKPINQPIK